MRNVIVAAILGFLPFAANGQDRAPRVLVTVIHFNPVMAPRDIVDGIQECRRDTICNSALNAGLRYVGVPPEVVTALRFIPTTGSRNGEETTDVVTAGQGTTICEAVISTTSVAPLHGDRASVFGITAASDKVSLYAWTPRQGIGGGRSWWDGTITLFSVSNRDLSRVRCGLLSGSASYVCRGDGQNRHGHQACGNSSLGELIVR
jgi:hypothetical protein